VATLVEHLSTVDGLTLVFVRTKRGADRLVGKLSREGVDAVAMHGDLSQRARERALERFETGKVRTLIADRRGRPRPRPGRRHARHQLRSARGGQGLRAPHRPTGRAGRSGIAVTFVLPEQQAETSRVANRLGHRERFEEAGMSVARPKLLYTSRRGRNSKW
jgi:superfamily II DNA/RNA helicase